MSVGTSQARWRTQLRFRLQERIGIRSHERRLHLADREVVLSAALSQVSIADSEWLILDARGFGSEAEALEFGGRLKKALEISSVASRVGVDAGQNLPMAYAGRALKEALAKDGISVRNNIHGLNVFQDDPKVGVLTSIGGRPTRVAPEPFLGDLDELMKSDLAASKATTDVILLFNYVLTRPG